MNKRAPIQIEAVGNGWIVKPPYDVSRDRTYSMDEVLVFNQMHANSSGEQALVSFIEKHFETAK